MVESCSTSLPGGDQVDGLPPAASFGEFFEKSWIFHVLTYTFGILYVSNTLMLKRMQEGLLLYRLLDRVLHVDRLTSQGSTKMMKMKQL